MGKLVAAFIMFLAASALAIHEAKPPPPPKEEPVAVASREATAPETIDHTPPSRAVHDAVPPWVKYASPQPPPPPRRIVVRIEPPRAFSFDSDSADDVPDVIDKCPDQPTTGERDDEDGCPEPARNIVLERSEIILYE